MTKKKKKDNTFRTSLTQIFQFGTFFFKILLKLGKMSCFWQTLLILVENFQNNFNLFCKRSMDFHESLKEFKGDEKGNPEKVPPTVRLMLVHP